VHHSAQDLGRLASQALLRLIAGEAVAHQLLPTQFMARLSTATPKTI
jgi:DNA-binding LacI/PurR family transcriptional regulator